ncbi:hypothetical protein V9K67_20465 [Paraflavisolibacter sp. H34]|uniref:hypothetical protein n=1 Tax=Huijunlia imazamoxiresistens TaxID=3127457 RepID=UPI00301B3B1E
MHLHNCLRNILQQLTEVLERLTDEQYTRPCATLSGATVGQHLRHIIDEFGCLERGYASGRVNYEARQRDGRIGQDRHFAFNLLANIYEELDKPDKNLTLEVNYDAYSDEVVQIDTNYHRELLYNLEHTIHHMALMKVGLNELGAPQLPEGFGVAPATLKFRKACAP